MFVIGGIEDELCVAFTEELYLIEVCIEGECGDGEFVDVGVVVFHLQYLMRTVFILMEFLDGAAGGHATHLELQVDSALIHHCQLGEVCYMLLFLPYRERKARPFPFSSIVLPKKLLLFSTALLGLLVTPSLVLTSMLANR